MNLTREEIGFVMRCFLRSIENTPPSERLEHKRIYDRFSEELVNTMEPKERKALTRAIDMFNGEYSR